MQTKSYKSRATAVRNSARAHLREIRRARLAEKRKPRVSEVTPEAEVAQDLPDTAFDVPEASAPEPHGAALPAPEPSADISEVDQETKAIEDAAMAEMMETHAPEARVDAVAPAPIVHDVAEPPAEDEADTVADVATEPAETAHASETQVAVDTADIAADPEDAPPPADTTARSDLYQLPGAGPGLVWMLEQVGITTLDGLALADAVTLTHQLGFVGEIIDVTGWISFAAAQMNEETSGGHNMDMTA